MAGNYEQIEDSELQLWEEEFIGDYAEHESLLPQFCMQQGVKKGSTVTFTIVQDDATVTSRSRGSRRINYGTPNQATLDAVVTESLGGETIDDFSAWKSSVDQRRIMYWRTEGAINRDMNQKVLLELDNATQVYNSGTAVALTRAHLYTILKTFRQNTHGIGGKTTALITEAALLQMEQIVEVTSRDYTDNMILEDGRKVFRWQGVLWVPYSELAGAGSASAKCYLFHERAIGWHGMSPNFFVGFNQEHRYYYCNGGSWCTAKMLLPNGVMEFHVNDTTAYT